MKRQKCQVQRSKTFTAQSQVFSTDAKPLVVKMSKYLRELFALGLNIGVPIHITRLSTLKSIGDINNLLSHKRNGLRDLLGPNRAFHAKRVCRIKKELVKPVLWLLVTVFYSRSIRLVWDVEFRCVIDCNLLGAKNVPTKKNMIALSS